MKNYYDYMKLRQDKLEAENKKLKEELRKLQEVHMVNLRLKLQVEFLKAE